MTRLAKLPNPVTFVLDAHRGAYQRGVLPIWTIYRHPSDYPNDYVARVFETGPGEPTPTKFIVRSSEIQALRTTFIHAGLITLPREDGDDPHIVESWV
jgi:hypothetical protein